MSAGALLSTRAILRRWQWEEHNVLAAIMLDWDDVLAVATRAASVSGQIGDGASALEELLRRYRASGATHVSIPELTLRRLLDKGELSVVQAADPNQVYLQAQDTTLAEWVTTELQARLPHLEAGRAGPKSSLISFNGDLPTLAEVGLGFDPAQAELAHRVGLWPVPRPVGYGWVQPAMLERTLSQAASLGARLIAVQGRLIPGFEFNINSTVEAMRRYQLTYAYFNVSRHQRGDWFLAKNLAEDGLVMLAHEFEPTELLEEDWHTISDRWANLALEAGVRLCSVRFFRVIHAADPLESLAYIQTLAGALDQAGFITGPAAGVDLAPFRPSRDTLSLVGTGLGAAGALGLAAELLPIPDELKLLGASATALALTSLPFWEASQAGHHTHQPDHQHEHAHPHSPERQHDDSHGRTHAHHDHEHHQHAHDHTHDRLRATAYAPKGLALATTVAYPAAAGALNGSHPGAALAHAMLVGIAGATALNATTTEADYVLGVESYRGYNLDWLAPLGLAAATALLRQKGGFSRWVPLAGAALAALKNFSHGWPQDMLLLFDTEHRHAHTHHLSAFQRALGDSKMALSPKPLRKWSLLAPVGAVSAAILKRRGQHAWAAVALTAAAAGQAATLAGFRNGQRPLLKTVEGRARSWLIGTILAGLVWLLLMIWSRLSGNR